MSIYGAMFAGVSGLGAQSQALGMIADNIANINTVGYKGATASFATLVTQSATSRSYSPGGVMSSPNQQIDRQGLLQGTTSQTDLAIAGSGFFVVNTSGTPGLGDEYLFTRAGSFTTDEEGNLVNSAGYYLQGWPLTSGALPANTSVVSSTQTVNVGNLAGAAGPTSALELGLNLPSIAAVGDTETATVQIFDSLGNAHDLGIVFTKAAVNSWTITVNDPTLSATGVTSGTVTAAARSITFNGDGTPATITFPAIAITGWTTGANDSSIAGDLGTANLTDGLTQFAGEYAISYLNQNGIQFGNYNGLTIYEEGIVTATFDNCSSIDIYKLAVAMFSNPNGLGARDGNAYVQTTFSGDVLLNEAKSGGAGVIASSALEASNIDLAEEFTRMITTQRAYSASAKIISTADEMLEELIRIRR